MVRCNVRQSGHDHLDVLIQTLICRPVCKAFNVNQRKPGHCVGFSSAKHQDTVVFFFHLWILFHQLSSEFFRDHSLPKVFARCFCFDHIPERVIGKSGIFWSYQVLQRVQHFIHWNHFFPFEIKSALFKTYSNYTSKLTSHLLCTVFTTTRITYDTMQIAAV